MSTFHVCFLIFIFVVLLVRNIHQYFRVWRFIEKIPGPRAIPIIGNILQARYTLEDNFNLILKWWCICKNDKFRFWVLNQPYVIISEPMEIKKVLCSNELIEKGEFYDLIRIWLGDGLLTTKGIKYFKHRKMITPLFNFEMLTQSAEIINRCGDKLIKSLSKYAESGEIFNVNQMISSFTLDAIYETSFGNNSLDNEKPEIIRAIKSLCVILSRRCFSPVKRFTIFYIFTSDYRMQQKAVNILKKSTFEIIEKRRKVIENENTAENGKVNNSKDSFILDHLLRAKIDGIPLTSQEIYDNIMTMIFGGFDTLLAAISYSLYVLSRYRDIQEKVFEEQLKIFGDNLKADATLAQLNQMHYLELVIKETLRLFPSVPFIARYTRDYFELGSLILDDHTIPPKTNVVLYLFGMGRNEKYFKDPLKFDPLRFMPENRTNKEAFDCLPFSAGLRSCPGRKYAMIEMKSVLSKIIRNYELLPTYDHCCDEETHNHDVNDKRLDPPILEVAVTLHSKNGVQLRLKNRKHL